MSDKPQFFGLHAQPGPYLTWALAAIPFILAIVIYMVAADIRHKENPQDKLLPNLSQMTDAAKRMAMDEDRRSGKILLWSDTAASLKRLAVGVALAAVVGLLLGLNMGLFPGMHVMLASGLTFISMIPPLSILPILFIMVGVDELAKVTLIFIGIFPVIARDILMAVNKIPREQITKALTLGATHLEVAYKIVLPQILPRLLESVRLALGAAWLFLIAAEAIAANEGLGYRIFLVRRYLAMDVIIPYVFWITILGFLFDSMLRLLLKKKFAWYVARG
ncbi:MAG: ABC transporter permease subunit [Gammaproteobacteria bacterium]|nr:ABC transporter permease subunit [Gammaproteobacteria bacterium]MDH5651974.1 ABC transporter permease subunit [Gammaproteobacteria bacterium]